MVNYHPSILYEYSKSQNLNLNGALREYVIERSVVFEKIKQEQKQNKLYVMSTGDIKTENLKAFNKENLPKNSSSKTLKDLHSDFMKIREHFYVRYLSGKFDKEYTKAVQRSKKKGLLQ